MNGCPPQSPQLKTFPRSINVPGSVYIADLRKNDVKSFGVSAIYTNVRYLNCDWKGRLCITWIVPMVRSNCHKCRPDPQSVLNIHKTYTLVDNMALVPTNTRCKSCSSCTTELPDGCVVQITSYFMLTVDVCKCTFQNMCKCEMLIIKSLHVQS